MGHDPTMIPWETMYVWCTSGEITGFPPCSLQEEPWPLIEILFHLINIPIQFKTHRKTTHFTVTHTHKHNQWRGKVNTNTVCIYGNGKTVSIALYCRGAAIYEHKVRRKVIGERAAVWNGQYEMSGDPGCSLWHQELLPTMVRGETNPTTYHNSCDSRDLRIMLTSTTQPALLGCLYHVHILPLLTNNPAVYSASFVRECRGTCGLIWAWKDAPTSFTTTLLGIEDRSQWMTTPDNRH